MAQSFTSRLHRHWFVLPATAILAGAFVVTRTADWAAEAQLIEVAVLFDLAVLLPALYFFCYCLGGKAPALRAVALACAGIWIAAALVPAEHQVILPWVSWLRYAAIGLLLYIELRVIAALYWAIVVGRGTTEDAVHEIATKTGLPHGVAMLMAKEAEVWKRLLAKPVAYLKGRSSRKEE